MKIILRTILIFLFTTPIVQATQYTPEMNDLKLYIDDLMEKSYQLLNNQKLTSSDRLHKTRQLIGSHLHLDWMAKYTLGHQRRVLSALKIDEFTTAYSQFVIKAYTDLATGYDGQKAVLKNIKNVGDNLFIANLEVTKSNGQPPIKIEYLVHKMNDSTTKPYLIGDIITEGISVLNSQQSEFNSVISNRGIDALIDELRDRGKA